MNHRLFTTREEEEEKNRKKALASIYWMETLACVCMNVCNFLALKADSVYYIEYNKEQPKNFQYIYTHRTSQPYNILLLDPGLHYTINCRRSVYADLYIYNAQGQIPRSSLSLSLSL